MPRAGYSRRNSASDVRLLVLVSALVLAFAVIPYSLLKGLPSPCLFHLLGLGNCPGCGMTRALWQLMHGHFAAALDLNWRVLIAAPILVWVYAQWIFRTIGIASRSGDLPRRPKIL
ncbi:MAG: DUF2752 domain-containing protein [bacterium]